jgi:hypothetical protein
MKPETVKVDPAAVAAIANGITRATFNARNPDFGAALLKVARRYVDMDREKNKDQIVAFLDMFDLPFSTKKADGTDDYTAYCACGISYAAAQAYQEFWTPQAASTQITQLRGSLPELDHYHFDPTPSVRDMQLVAMGKRRWYSARGKPESRPTPKPGYIVIYKFDQGYHCGIVESATKTRLTTIEFNTTSGIAGDQRNGGVVAHRTRPYGEHVEGFIAMDSAV